MEALLVMIHTSLSLFSSFFVVISVLVFCTNYTRMAHSSVYGADSK
jgi:hypothetical protein